MARRIRVAVSAAAAPTTSPTSSPPPSPTTPPSTRTFSNGADYPIADGQRIYSPVSSTASGQAVSPVTLSITIRHTCAEDLGISLVAPDGTLHAVKYSGGWSCAAWNGAKTYRVAVNESAAGTWRLRVTDYYAGDTGAVDAWSITL